MAHRFEHPYPYRVSGICLAAALALGAVACGDATGTPIVMAQGGRSNDFGGSTGGYNLHGDLGGGGGFTSGLNGGLCSPCQSKDDCGGRNDFCLFNGGTNESFCGMDCIDQNGCPDGYACMSLGTGLIQCAPVSGSCDNPFGSQTGFVSLIDLRRIVLDKINGERSRKGVFGLAMSDCLASVAQSAAVEFTSSGVTSGKFDSDCKSLIPNCACGWESDNQSHESGNGTWTDLVTWSAGEILNQSNAPMTVLSDHFSRAGVGVVVGQGEVWVSVDLAP